MGFEIEGDGVPAYLQPDKEPDLEDLPAAPSGHAAVPAGRAGNQVNFQLSCPSGILFLTFLCMHGIENCIS